MASNDIKILDSEYSDTSRYSPEARGIYINVAKDRTSYKGHPAYSYIIHEIGHLIDHRLGEYSGWRSANFGGGIFGETLRQDANHYLNNTRLKLKIDALAKGENPQTVNDEEVYAAVKKELWGLTTSQKADVSDIWHGATQAKVHGGWLHNPTYWNDSTALPREAFAEMFYASIANQESLAQINKYFPKSYRIFLDMIDDFVRGA